MKDKTKHTEQRFSLGTRRTRKQSFSINKTLRSEDVPLVIHNRVPFLVRPNNRNEPIHEVAHPLVILEDGGIQLLRRSAKTVGREKVVVLLHPDF
jgi:hypothetical protein